MINYYYKLISNLRGFASEERNSVEDLIEILFKEYENLNKSIDMWKLREKLIKRYAWAIPSPKAIELIKNYLPIYEVGAGSGYWARMITSLIDSESYYAYDPLNDNYEFTHNWYNVRKNKLENSNRTLFLCWPPYDTSMAYDAVTENNPEILIYVGEGSGGCTGDYNFHNLLDENYEEIKFMAIPQFRGINDYLWIYKRK